LNILFLSYISVLCTAQEVLEFLSLLLPCIINRILPIVGKKRGNQPAYGKPQKKERNRPAKQNRRPIQQNRTNRRQNLRTSRWNGN
jgi:hypothetical protein